MDDCVERVGHVVLAGVLGANPTGAGFDSDQRLPQVGRCVAAQDAVPGGDRGLLRRDVDGGGHPQAGAVHGVLGDAPRRQLVLDLADEIPLGSGQLVGGRLPGGQRGVHRRGRARRLQPTLFGHAVEHVTPALPRGLRMQGWVVAAGGANAGGEHRALLHGEDIDRLSEVGLRGRLDPVGAAAEVDGVEVVLQDGVLGAGAVELDRDEDLANLAPKGPGLGQVGVLGVLLGDGRAALLDAAAAQVGQHRAGDAGHRDPGLGVVVAVLGGEHRLAHLLRHPRQRDVGSVLRPQPTDLGSPVGVGHHGGLRGADIAGVGHLGGGIDDPNQDNEQAEQGERGQQQDAPGPPAPADGALCGPGGDGGTRHDLGRPRARLEPAGRLPARRLRETPSVALVPAVYDVVRWFQAHERQTSTTYTANSSTSLARVRSWAGVRALPASEPSCSPYT